MLADVTGTADHVLRNRAVWDQWASSYAGAGLRRWSAAEPTWGIWGIPEAQAGVLPSGLDGADSIELGCGTGYVSAWLARRGARPGGLDNSPGQLRTARELQQRFGLRFPLFHANAERAPFADARFDLAISEYGASIWCDPYLWIPEAARLLREAGLLGAVLLQFPQSFHRTPGSFERLESLAADLDARRALGIGDELAVLLQGFLALRGFTLDDIDGMAVSSGVPRVKESLRLLADRYLDALTREMTALGGPHEVDTIFNAKTEHEGIRALPLQPPREMRQVREIRTQLDGERQGDADQDAVGMADRAQRDRPSPPRRPKLLRGVAA